MYVAAVRLGDHGTRRAVSIAIGMSRCCTYRSLTVCAAFGERGVDGVGVGHELPRVRLVRAEVGVHERVVGSGVFEVED